MKALTRDLRAMLERHVDHASQTAQCVFVSLAKTPEGDVEAHEIYRRPRQSFQNICQEMLSRFQQAGQLNQTNVLARCEFEVPITAEKE